MPKFYVNNLQGRYEAIQDYLKDKYHASGLACDPSGKYKPTAEEQARIDQVTEYANMAAQEKVVK